MTKHNEHSHHHHENEPFKKRPFHHDWRFWVAVILMLGAMGMYVYSLDEANPPGGPVGPPMPAADAG